MKKHILALLMLASFGASAQNDPTTTVGDTGTVMFTYEGSPVTYTTVRAADGQIWLQQNLGAAQVAASSTDNASYGALFQWGRWDDGHQQRTSATASALVLSFNNPAGLGTGSPLFYTGSNPNDWWGVGLGTDTWSDQPTGNFNGKDPCTVIGPDWHLPSEAEWGALLAAEGITDANSAFASSLKLPLSGMREPTAGNLLNVDLYANYWTSTITGPYAKDVTILTSGINASDDALRSYGFSVRCMATCTGLLEIDSIQMSDSMCTGSIESISVPQLNNANGYNWTLPAGWSIVGIDSGNVINVLTGSAGGTVMVSGYNSCGVSDTASDVVLTMQSPTPVINANGDVLTTGTFTGYQWLMNGLPITGAQSSSYIAAQSGIYSVVVTAANGCSDTSAPYNHIALGIGTIEAPSFSIYPNPASNELQVDAPDGSTAIIYSMDGRVLMNVTASEPIDISRLANGLYLFRLRDATGNLSKALKLQVIR